MENLIVWFELPVTNMERAKKFYSEVFQLDIQVEDLGDTPYGFFPIHGYGNSGALVKSMDFQPSAKAARIYLNGGQDLADPLSCVELLVARYWFPRQ